MAGQRAAGLGQRFAMNRRGAVGRRSLREIDATCGSEARRDCVEAGKHEGNTGHPKPRA